MEITMNEPIVFYLASPEIVTYTIKFPSGKIHILKRGDKYTTEDKEEQDFLSKQKYIGAAKLNDKEFRMWATLQFDKIPTVYNKQIETKEDIEEYLWNSDTEQLAINKLKENGYTVYKNTKKKAK